MRVAVFSDVHANLPALETFVADTRGRVDGYVCLGDVVNYGPWNDECLDVVVSLPGIVFIEGNHERLFLGTEAIADEHPLVQQFYAASIARFTRRSLIENLALQHDLGDFSCVHTIDHRRIYADTEVPVDGSYFIGHTHHAFDVTRKRNRIVNCGSIGQNRRRVDRLNYALVDTGSGDVALMERDYPVEILISEMKRLNYPRACLDYYYSKLPG
ncbi:MAG TPA: metallophosphoesterase family protein [Stellaceae bacterium]|jgi:predicted phosphodiesterase